MASLFGKILSGVMLAGSSVLSVVAPPIGAPILAASVGFAGSQWGTTDPVTASGQAVSTGQTQAITQAQINANAQLGSQLASLQAYNGYVNQGYSPAQASAMSGYNAAPVTTFGLPTWLPYVGIGLGAFLVLKLLKIIK